MDEVEGCRGGRGGRDPGKQQCDNRIDAKEQQAQADHEPGAEDLAHCDRHDALAALPERRR
jgi:hypothetical protein